MDTPDPETPVHRVTVLILHPVSRLRMSLFHLNVRTLAEAALMTEALRQRIQDHELN